MFAKKSRLTFLSSLVAFVPVIACAQYGPYCKSAGWSQFSGPSYAYAKPMVGTYFFPWYDALTTYRDPGTGLNLRYQIDRINSAGSIFDYLTVHPDSCVSYQSMKSNATHDDYLKRKPSVFRTSGSSFTNPLFSVTDTNWEAKEMNRMANYGIDTAFTIFRNFNEGPRVAGSMGAGLNYLYNSKLKYPQVAFFDDTPYLPDNDTASADRFADAVIAFYSNIHPRFWFRINGHPVVGLYSEHDLGSNLRNMVTRIQSRVQGQLGATVAFYGTPAHTNRGIPVELNYAWGAAAVDPGYRTVPGVQHYVTEIGPGYDFLGVNRNPRRVGNTYNTRRYSSAWDYAIALRNKVVMIETWNEYIEATSIAQTKEYGLMYLDVTKSKSAIFKR